MFFITKRRHLRLITHAMKSLDEAISLATEQVSKVLDLQRDLELVKMERDLLRVEREAYHKRLQDVFVPGIDKAIN